VCVFEHGNIQCLNVSFYLCIFSDIHERNKCCIVSCAGCICDQDVRAICESFANMRGLPNYPHGIIFTFWEQYVSLRFYLTMAVVAALAAVFVTLAIILLNIVAAFLVVL